MFWQNCSRIQHPKTHKIFQMTCCQSNQRHLNYHALMLMFGAGEHYPFIDCDDYHVPTQILKSQDDLLKNLAYKSLSRLATTKICLKQQQN